MIKHGWMIIHNTHSKRKFWTRGFHMFPRASEAAARPEKNHQVPSNDAHLEVSQNGDTTHHPVIGPFWYCFPYLPMVLRGSTV